MNPLKLIPARRCGRRCRGNNLKLNSARNDRLTSNLTPDTPCRRRALSNGLVPALQFIALVLVLSFAVSPSATAATYYVNASNPAPVAPYSDWSTAATNIQDAVDAASAGDLLLVTNGVYEAGSSASPDGTTNRLAVNKPVTLLGLSGAVETVIDGGHLMRCAYVTNGALLVGFTLTNGVATVGAGVWCEPSAIMVNCVLTGNTQSSSAQSMGGGAYGGALYNCALITNSSAYGGGAAASTLYNCALTGNSAIFGGGTFGVMANNCAFIDNWSRQEGGGAFSCVWGGCPTDSPSILNNCTLTGNWSLQDGGGAAYCTLNNCVLTNNWAQTWSGGGAGGGASQCSLNQCLLIGNWVPDTGGGAVNSTLNDCTLSRNSAYYGGGAAGCTLNGCLLTGNSGRFGAAVGGGTLNNCTAVANPSEMGAVYSVIANNCVIYANPGENYGALYLPDPNVLNYCCTTPLPTNGIGNITNDPVLFNPAAGDFHLQSNSPCINAGKNAYIVGSMDLDGNPRISGGTVDVGAYEFQNPASIISYAWLDQYGLPTDGSADFVDSDGDGMNNWQEWRAGTDPTNPLSVLEVLSPSITTSNVTVSWESVGSRLYYLMRSTNLGAPGSFTMIATNIPGASGTTSYMDPNAPSPGPAFYRVGVQ